MLRRLEWIVEPTLHKDVRDHYLSQLLDLERQGRIWLWMEHWHDTNGQFRYKYIITPIRNAPEGA